MIYLVFWSVTTTLFVVAGIFVVSDKKCEKIVNVGGWETSIYKKRKLPTSPKKNLKKKSFLNFFVRK